jgi:uncharacterized membrane protein (Fun14 family)
VIGLMDIENLGNVATSLVSGTVVGILIGYAVKKVLRIGLVILGTFFAALTYLQFQGVLSVNWDKVEMISKNTLTTVLNSEIAGNSANSLLANLGLPLTGSMAMGFAVGFMKG